MTVKELCVIAIIGAIEFVVFTSFSFILYLECITFTVLIFSVVFPIKIAVSGAVVFDLLNIVLIQGITPWSLCYLGIYPVYSWIFSTWKQPLPKKLWLLAFVCAFFSFLTGQLLQLPFLLFSKTLTILYLILGLKTSLIQGALSAMICLFLYHPTKKALCAIERKLDL
ncbi:cytochrome B [Faecalicoccus acidiformans]|uniref:Cytochrome B n=1 Tax=Faecalicoccus acidiformans TaxID=915173 RepID=A0ABS2FPD0_9FIRM|nr:cytochrome B [Faecalicoccus acidiformans]MBM6831290.1 cytochrome B [Faecalicoccus acidiformans]